MSGEELKTRTRLAKRLLREGKYKISEHVLSDHPERMINADDIIECLKIGEVARLEPREANGQTQYVGADRYRWYGQDQKDRVIRLMLVIENHMVVVSAAEATPNQKAKYLAEDQEGLAQDEEGSEDLKKEASKKEDLK